MRWKRKREVALLRSDTKIIADAVETSLLRLKEHKVVLPRFLQAGPFGCEVRIDRLRKIVLISVATFVLKKGDSDHLPDEFLPFRKVVRHGNEGLLRPDGRLGEDQFQPVETALPKLLMKNFDDPQKR